MELNHRIKISLLDFVKTGRFECVTLGRTKEWMKLNFADPDYKHHFSKSTSLWGYGDFEVYFSNDSVSMIRTDQIETLKAGSNVELDKSIFENSANCLLSNIQNEFNELDMDYHVVHRPGIEQVVLKVIKSNVELGFGFHGEKPHKRAYELLFIQVVSPEYYKS